VSSEAASSILYVVAIIIAIIGIIWSMRSRLDSSNYSLGLEPHDGEWQKAVAWLKEEQKPPRKKTCADTCESTFSCDYTCGEGAEPTELL